jgi:hypothetical protein
MNDPGPAPQAPDHHKRDHDDGKPHDLGLKPVILAHVDECRKAAQRGAPGDELSDNRGARRRTLANVGGLLPQVVVRVLAGRVPMIVP